MKELYVHFYNYKIFWLDTVDKVISITVYIKQSKKRYTEIYYLITLEDGSRIKLNLHNENQDITYNYNFRNYTFFRVNKDTFKYLERLREENSEFFKSLIKIY